MHLAKPGGLEPDGFLLRPLLPDDAAFAYALAIANPWSFRWSVKTALPSLEVFALRAWQWTVARFVLMKASGEAAGILVLHGTDGSEDFRTLDIVFADWEYAIAQFGTVSDFALSYFFKVSRINKIYIDFPRELHESLSESFPKYLLQEAVLPAYYFMNGQRQDRIISA